MLWQVSHRFDKAALPLADRHYNRQKVGSPQFVPPGRCHVLLTPSADALWVSAYPYAEYVRHAWAGAWVNSMFRNEGSALSSLLILDAIASTRTIWPVPALGMITFIDRKKVRGKKHFGYCYLKAGFSPAVCPEHGGSDGGSPGEPECAACRSRTKAGLYALQMLEGQMPDAREAIPMKNLENLPLFD